MSTLSGVWIALLFPVYAAAQHINPNFPKNVGVEVIWGEAGQTADLPCDVDSLSAEDKVNMVLWFKDSPIPLYSVDARERELSKATHSALSSELGRRSFFISGPPARLRLTGLIPQDQGIFRCRVDFLNSPTRNQQVNLTFIRPPSEPKIFDAEGTELRQTSGPYLEGEDIHLTCHVSGGEPSPRLSWWLDERELTERTGTGPGLGRTSTRLEMEASRHLHQRRVSCQAQPTNTSTPVSTSILLRVYLKPLNVKIVSTDELISAGRVTHIICESVGSYPPANITWLQDGQTVTNAPTMVATESYSTRSTLALRPSRDEDGKELICRASNLNYPEEFIEDKRILKIAYAPSAEIKVISDVNPDSLKEGDVAKLVCETKANPSVESFMWYHGSELRSERGAEFDLGQLTADSRGQYSCFVRNSEGAARSKSRNLRVRYVPFCKPGMEERNIGGVPKKTIRADCEVVADPEDDVKFSWTLNRTREVIAVPNSWVSSAGLTSHVEYSPSSEEGFGTLACWAANSLGNQAKPCLVHLVHAKSPGVPEECGLNNHSEWVEVECKAGSDGGLPQHFVLEVKGEERKTKDEGKTKEEEAQKVAPVYRLHSQQPRFRLQGLEPDRRYALHIFAKNAKGVSHPPVVIQGVHIPASTEKLTGQDLIGNDTISVYWIVLCGVLAAAAVLVVALCFAILCKKKSKEENIHLNNLGPSVRIRFPGETDSDF